MRARKPSRLFTATLTLLAATIVLAAVYVPVSAHFLLNANLRVVHVEHLDDGLRLYMRLPMPYLVAHLLGEEEEDGEREPAPYTTNHYEGQDLVHYVDVDAVLEDPLGLGLFAAEGHRIIVDGREIAPQLEATRAYPSLEQPIFSTLEQAREALQGPAYPDETAATYVGDTVVDVALRYVTGEPVYRYSFAGALNPGLPGQEDTENLLHDNLYGEVQTFTGRGLLIADAMEISRKPLAAAWTFIVEGVRHILEGLDHVLFVLCLIIGAAGLKSLVWRVTGFTLGHTVTLIAGFMGFVPTAPWFIPLVETGIALSIIYAAVIAVLRRPDGGTFLVTTAIGLLHGFGFSFVLQEILSIEAPNVWQSLLAFNLGVEIGQLAIVLAVWPLLMLLSRWDARVARAGRWAVAAPCIAVATFWAGERALSLLQGLS